RDADFAVAMKDAVKRLPLVATAQRIGIAGKSAAQGTDVAIDGPVTDRDRCGRDGRWIAAIEDLHDLRAGIAWTDIGLDRRATRCVVGRVGDLQVEADAAI